MNRWDVLTSKDERQALPCSRYIVYNADTENEAIDICFSLVKRQLLKPANTLSRYSIPDYTCAIKKD